MPRPLGPPRVQLYTESHGRYRVRVIINGAAKSRTFSSRKEAETFQRTVTAELPSASSGRTLEELLIAYCDDKVRLGTCKQQTSEQQLERLRGFFADYAQSELSAITPRRAALLYEEATQQVDARSGKKREAATHRHYLALAKGFFAWAESQNFVHENPFKKVRPIGRVSAGKTQLSFDEGERFIAAALRLYEEGNDVLALASLVALMMGFRVSEVLGRQVRDLDGNGTYLRVGEGKTKNARRCLRVPAVLRPHLSRLAQDKPPTAPLFGAARDGKPLCRQMMNSAVHRVCKAAGVPLVCPHSLRGLWASISVESGALPDMVAAALGHGSFTMTARHYAQPESLHSARTNRLEQAFGLDVRAIVGQLSADEIISLLPAETLSAVVEKAGPVLARKAALPGIFDATPALLPAQAHAHKSRTT